jgi:hypothetical protein
LSGTRVAHIVPVQRSMYSVVSALAGLDLKYPNATLSRAYASV